ncbi:MAG TPA: DUF5663 domain-containing protein [Candidatus Saccharimonadales bacterium]|nr:DUF5663 domain-containing protein [Candidatus Saccharimonadales bacterium]
MNNDQNQPMQIDDNFLATLGLGDLSDQDKRAFVLHLREELEVRVGEALAEQLTDEQLDEFGGIAESNDAEAAALWLRDNCPGYEQVVAGELEKLKQEIIQNRDTLTGAGATSSQQ